MSVKTIQGYNAYNLEYLGIKQTKTGDNLSFTKSPRSSNISISIICNNSILLNKRNYVKAIIKRDGNVLTTGYININFDDELDINALMILCSRYSKKKLLHMLRIHHYY